MNMGSLKLSRALLVGTLAISATLVSIQSAEASSFYGRGENEEHGTEHGGCGGGGGGHDCVITNYTSSYYAFQTDIARLMDGDISSLRNLKVGIDYSLPSVALDSAYLFIKARDDATGSNADSTSRNGDGQEFLDILKVEGQNVSVNAVEINSSDWYFKFNVKDFVTGSHTSPLDMLLASVNLEHGQSDLIFQNARLDLNYHTEYCPPPSAVPLPAAAWLFGSALFGFMTLSNRRKV
jgi:hypothetical protein